MSETHVRFYYRGQTYMVPMEFIARQHPGGCNILLAEADRDITKLFEKYNHSIDALEILRPWRVSSSTSGKPMKKEETMKVKEVVSTEEDDSEEELRKEENGNQPKTQRAPSFWNRVAISIGMASAVAAVGMSSKN